MQEEKKVLCIKDKPIVGTLFNFDITKEDIRKAKKENRLLDLDLELTKKCNLRCNYCYANSGKPLPNEMTLDEIKSVIKQGKELGVKTLCIVGGENHFCMNIFSMF